MLRRLLLLTFMLILVIAILPNALAQAGCDPAQDHALLGARAHDSGDDNLALIHLQCALLRDPTQADALYRMGMIHINRGESHEAKHYFDRAAAAEDDDLLVYLLGEDARSVLDPDDLKQLSLTSPAPGESGEYLRPGAVYERKVLIVIWTRQGQDQAQARLTDNRDALGKLERALERDPARHDLRCELGALYMARGDYAAAFNHYQFLIREKLGDHCRDEKLANMPATFAPPNAANLALALERDPTRADLRCELGAHYMARGDYAAAFNQYQVLIREELGDHC